MKDWFLEFLPPMAGLACGLLMSYQLFPVSHAQKVERGTQHWTISVPLTTSFGDGNVHVFDMSGTCLYVFTYGDKEGGIAVISKATLPAGTGCQ